MLWWIVLSVVVIGLALLWVRGRSGSHSGHLDPDAMRRRRGDAESHGGGGPGGF